MRSISALGAICFLSLAPPALADSRTCTFDLTQFANRQPPWGGFTASASFSSPPIAFFGAGSDVDAFDNPLNYIPYLECTARFAETVQTRLTAAVFVGPDYRRARITVAGPGISFTGPWVSGSGILTVTGNGQFTVGSNVGGLGNVLITAETECDSTNISCGGGSRFYRVESASFTVSSTGSCTMNLVSGNNQQGSPGGRLPLALVVSLTSASGRPLPGSYIPTWSASGDARVFGSDKGVATLGSVPGPYFFTASLDGCGSATFTATAIPTCTPTASPSLATPPPASFSGNGWTANYNFSPASGLTLTDVKLGPRKLAQSVSVPYLEVSLSNFAANCNLKPNGSDPICRSQLREFKPSVNALEATYELTQIPANSCNRLLVTQRYEFQPIDPSDPCEPTETATLNIFPSLVCAKFKPIVSYTFFGDGQNSSLLTLRIAQRVHYASSPPNLDASGQAMAVFKDRDFPPAAISVYGNPAPTELLFNAVSFGRAGDADNLHQTYFARVDEPVDTNPPNGRPSHLLPPGCPECVHTHWRWSSFFGQQWNSGLPLVPHPTDQSVDIALVRYRESEETAPNAISLVDNETIAGFPTVTWFIGTGRKPSESFFSFGTFYSPCGIEQRQGSDGVQFIRGRTGLQSGVYTIPLTIKNNTPATLRGPLSLVLSQLSTLQAPSVLVRLEPGAVKNAAQTVCLDKGSAFVNVPGGQLGPGSQVTVFLEIAAGATPLFVPKLTAAGVP